MRVKVIVKVIRPKNDIFEKFALFCTVYLTCDQKVLRVKVKGHEVKVKCHKGQGQIRGSKQRQVGSHQRQVASFVSCLKSQGFQAKILILIEKPWSFD